MHDITPETRVGALLDDRPELEEVLIALSPAFERLRNPVLRRTVARVATLRQVARVGDVPLGTLVARLRSAAGLDAAPAPHDDPEGGAPPWGTTVVVTARLDARPLLDAGQHPIDAVMRGAVGLERGQALELLTPFVPAPLVERLEAKGYATWSQRLEPELVRTLVTRP